MTRILLFFAAVVSAAASDNIAFIEFFGCSADTEAVRQALPFHKGDPFSDSVKIQARDTVRRITGKDATDVAAICCTNGDHVLFIGLPGACNRPMKFDPAPTRDLRVSRELATLHDAMDKAEMAAIRKGASQEDDAAPGYRLMKDPGGRAAELRVRDYALHHEAELLEVAASARNTNQRAIAVDVLGYGNRSPQQIATLVRAARDPEELVRNQSTRALGEILRADLSIQVAPDTFIELALSGAWTDRNKGTWVLNSLSASRDPKLLDRVRKELRPALEEMAAWRAGWNLDAQMILGRL